MSQRAADFKLDSDEAVLVVIDVQEQIKLAVLCGYAYAANDLNAVERKEYTFVAGNNQGYCI